jgi:YfiH family protein
VSQRPASPSAPAGIRLVRELASGDYPLHQHPDWSAAFPWLVQGTTGRGADGLDMGLFGDVPTGLAQARWRRLREVAGMAAAVHARQVHGAALRWHTAAEGFTVLEGLDGHGTAAAGIVLTVSVADCVPVFLVSVSPRGICLLHAGWRGVAAGVLEAGIDLLGRQLRAAPHNLHLHCGPAICGNCYEVGPEVPAALQLAESGDRRTHVDLRATIAQRAVRAGLQAANVTLSTHCTRCGDQSFWSHRGGSHQRQVGILGLRS